MSQSVVWSSVVGYSVIKQKKFLCVRRQVHVSSSHDRQWKNLLIKLLILADFFDTLSIHCAWILQVLVDVGASTVSLLVVRAQGLVGQVSVEWTTVDGTALSSGKISPDYVVRCHVLVNDVRCLYTFTGVISANKCWQQFHRATKQRYRRTMLQWHVPSRYVNQCRHETDCRSVISSLNRLIAARFISSKKIHSKSTSKINIKLRHVISPLGMHATSILILIC